MTEIARGSWVYDNIINTIGGAYAKTPMGALFLVHIEQIRLLGLICVYTIHLYILIDGSCPALHCINLSLASFRT